MFDKVSQAAEKLATHVSRRDFLGRLGKGALVVAGVLGGMLAIGGTAEAFFCPPGYATCGQYCCPTGTYCCICNLIGGLHCTTTPPKGCRCRKV